MVGFRIDAKEFANYLSMIHLNGLVYDCIVGVGGGILTTAGLDVAKAIYFRVVSKAEVIEQGDLVIGNIAMFNRILSRFDGTVTVMVDNKKKVISIKRKNKLARFEVPEKKAIDSFAKADLIKIKKDRISTPTLKLKYTTCRFTLDSQELESIVGDADILDEHIYYIIASEDGIVRLKVQKGRDRFVTKFRPERAKILKDVSACFGHGVKEIFKTVKGEVRLYLEPKPPMLIRFGEKYKSLYLIMTREES